jgi:hypothetical protein
LEKKMQELQTKQSSHGSTYDLKTYHALNLHYQNAHHGQKTRRRQHLANGDTIVEAQEATYKGASPAGNHPHKAPSYTTYIRENNPP